MSRQDADEDTRSTDDSGDETKAQPSPPQESDASVDDQSADTPDDEIEAILEAIGTTDAAIDAVDPSFSAREVQLEQELVSAVECSTDEAIAGALATVRAQRETLRDALADERERADDLESRLKRKQADFQNYKKRQKERMEEEKQRATEDLVERLFDVRDNLERALEQDESADIRGGIESTLDQFDQELARENVSAIEPTPGDDVDPQRHEVLIRIESSQPADTVADVHRPGYEMAGKVLRPAQVAVSDGSGSDDTSRVSDEGDHSR